MEKSTIEQKGSIYFFYRPKIEVEKAHNLQDVQKLFIVLKPENQNQYIIAIVTKKLLPKNNASGFVFIDKIVTTEHQLIKFLEEEIYYTKTKGQRILPEARCLGEGKYFIMEHEDHTHLIYELTQPANVHKVQAEFNIHKQDNFIINILNPKKSTPGYVGIVHTKKADYPKVLMDRFNDNKFISVKLNEFLNYENAEFILTSVHEKAISEEKTKSCFKSIVIDDITKALSLILDHKSLIPMLNQKWS